MPIRVASFDIGIRNMAYCVFSIDATVSILDWGVINMLSSDAPSFAPVCQVVLEQKSKKPTAKSSSAQLCGKKAKFCSPSGLAASTCFCAMHAAKHGTWILPQKEHSLAHLRKQKAEAIQSIYQSLFLLEPVERIRSKTKPVLTDEIRQWYEKTCFRPVAVEKKKKTSNDTDLITIGRTMRDRLDAIDAFRGVTHVVIENQISPIATRMKTVQGMLTQYFLMREHCADGGGSPIDVEYVSSCNKLKGFTIPTTEVTTQKDKYKQHKADSVRICTEMIRENFPESAYILSTSTKKDDLADCFLQGIWYLQRENIITYAENLKINIVRLS